MGNNLGTKFLSTCCSNIWFSLKQEYWYPTREEVFILGFKSSAYIFFLKCQWTNQQTTRVKHQREIVFIRNLFLPTSTTIILCRPNTRQFIFSHLPMYSIHIYIWHPLTKLTPFSYPVIISLLLYKFAHQFYKPNIKTLLKIQGLLRIDMTRHHHLWRGRKKSLGKCCKGLIFFPFCKSFTRIKHGRKMSIRILRFHLPLLNNKT